MKTMRLDHKKDIDKDLVMRIRGGDQAAFTQLVKRWHPKIYNFAFRYSNDRIFAEEVVQKTFLQLYEKIDQLRDAAKFRGWFYRIINNECFTEGRKVKRKQDLFTVTSTFPGIADRSNPEEMYNRKERGKVVLQVLQQLPKEQRQVILMKEYEDLKFREIAEILGESENTIKSRMYYGLDAMRKILLNHKWTKELYHG